MNDWLNIPEEPKKPRWWQFWRLKQRRKCKEWSIRVSFCCRVLSKYGPRWLSDRNEYQKNQRKYTLETLQQYLDGTIDRARWTTFLMLFYYGDEVMKQVNDRVEISNKLPNKKGFPG